MKTRKKLEEKKVSISPDGKEFPLPSKEDYENEVKKVRELAKKAKDLGNQVVVVQGLGFVGAVMAAIVAQAEKKFVIGLQRASKRSYWKIPYINQGISPIESEDPKVKEIIKNGIEKEKLYATYVEEAISLGEIVISDIQCDVKKLRFGNSRVFTVEIEPFIEASKEVASLITPSSLYLIETTVPPGTSEYIVRPIFEEAFKKRIVDELRNLKKKNLDEVRELVRNSDFLREVEEEVVSYVESPMKEKEKEIVLKAFRNHRPRIAHSYERVMPGREYVDSVINFPRVFSGVDEVSATMAQKFLSEVLTGPNAKLTRLATPTDSEFAKCAENTYRASIIALGRALGRMAEIMNVDFSEVVDAIKIRPTHRDIMVPRTPTTGGYCLPKDPLFLLWSLKNIPEFKEKLSKENKEALRRVMNLISLIVDINDTDGIHAVELVERELKKIGKKLKVSKVLVAGASYREDVADTRYASYETIVRYLREKGAEVSVTDPYVKSLPELEYQEEDKYSLAKFFARQRELKFLKVNGSFEEAAKGVDAIIFAVPHEPYKKLTPEKICSATGKPPQEIVVVDCGTFNKEQAISMISYGLNFEKMYHGNFKK
ncbi:MAG: UDP binding domain-containing protein [Thermoproteota archaeon]|nr:GDP-mannose dehydrogenase [Candidatus Brockarchaeota archaeon]